jgi:hypothetical protein
VSVKGEPDWWQVVQLGGMELGSEGDRLWQASQSLSNSSCVTVVWRASRKGTAWVATLPSQGKEECCCVWQVPVHV